MAAPITSFETIESIRFFASLVGTEGVSMDVKNKVNEYLYKLVVSLESSVIQTVAGNAGIVSLNG